MTSSTEQAVVVHYTLSTGDYGSTNERSAYYALQHELRKAIRGYGVLGGNEFGNGEAIFYLYGADAERLFARLEPVLRGLSARPAYALLQVEGEDDRRVDI